MEIAKSERIKKLVARGNVEIALEELLELASTTETRIKVQQIKAKLGEATIKFTSGKIDYYELSENVNRAAFDMLMVLKEINQLPEQEPPALD